MAVMHCQEFTYAPDDWGSISTNAYVNGPTYLTNITIYDSVGSPTSVPIKFVGTNPVGCIDSVGADGTLITGVDGHILPGPTYARQIGPVDTINGNTCEFTISVYDGTQWVDLISPLFYIYYPYGIEVIIDGTYTNGNPYLGNKVQLIRQSDVFSAPIKMALLSQTLSIFDINATVNIINSTGDSRIASLDAGTKSYDLVDGVFTIDTVMNTLNASGNVTYQGCINQTCYNNILTFIVDPFLCGGLRASDPNVCTQRRGTCISESHCNCTAGYFGDSCELYQCYGLDATDPNACDGHGSCYNIDQCSCYPWLGYGGLNCSTPTLRYIVTPDAQPRHDTYPESSTIIPDITITDLYSNPASGIPVKFESVSPVGCMNNINSDQLVSDVDGRVSPGNTTAHQVGFTNATVCNSCQYTTSILDPLTGAWIVANTAEFYIYYMKSISPVELVDGQVFLQSSQQSIFVGDVYAYPIHIAVLTQTLIPYDINGTVTFTNSSGDPNVATLANISGPTNTFDLIDGIGQIDHVDINVDAPGQVVYDACVNQFCDANVLTFLINDHFCYGVDASDQNVCGGHGQCVDENTCSCQDGYSGTSCQVSPTTTAMPTTSASPTPSMMPTSSLAPTSTAVPTTTPVPTTTIIPSTTVMPTVMPTSTTVQPSSTVMLTTSATPTSTLISTSTSPSTTVMPTVMPTLAPVQDWSTAAAWTTGTVCIVIIVATIFL